MPVADHRKPSRRPCGHDHHRGKRVQCGAGTCAGRQRVYPQTVHSGPGQRMRASPAGTMTMKSLPCFSAPAALFDRATWTPLLELSTREVFEIMLGTRLSLMERRDENNGDVTALVGLAGSLCGVLSIRCSNPAEPRAFCRQLRGRPGCYSE